MFSAFRFEYVGSAVFTVSCDHKRNLTFVLDDYRESLLRCDQTSDVKQRAQRGSCQVSLGKRQLGFEK